MVHMVGFSSFRRTAKASEEQQVQGAAMLTKLCLRQRGSHGCRLHCGTRCREFPGRTEAIRRETPLAMPCDVLESLLAACKLQTGFVGQGIWILHMHPTHGTESWLSPVASAFDTPGVAGGVGRSSWNARACARCTWRMRCMQLGVTACTPCASQAVAAASFV